MTQIFRDDDPRMNNHGMGMLAASSSAQSHAPLLQSTDTFASSKQQFSNNNSSINSQTHMIIRSNDNDVIPKQPYKKVRIKKLVRVMLVFGTLLLLIIAIISVILAIDIYVTAHGQQNNKTISSHHQQHQHHQKVSTTTTTTTTSQATTPTTTTEKKFVKWQHCGQTWTNPNVDTQNLLRSQQHRQKRIIGGEDAARNSWPWLVSIRLHPAGAATSKHGCAGVLISTRYVLTAGHCLFEFINYAVKAKTGFKKMFEMIKIHVGIHDHKEQPENLADDQVYSIEYFDIHSEFNFNNYSFFNDVALLKLKSDVHLNRSEVNVACLPDQPLDDDNQVLPGDEVVVIGWGTYAEEYEHDLYTWDHLQQTVLQVLDGNDELCNTGNAENTWDKNTTLCLLGRNKRTGTCFGDSGGPAMIYRNDRWITVGIVSFGSYYTDPITQKNKCNASMPVYFVKVAEYMDWIRQSSTKL